MAKKYLISIAEELDGHAGSYSVYVETNDMSKKFISELIGKLFTNKDAKVTFVEADFSVERNNIAEIYGTLNTKYDGDDFTYEDDSGIAVSVKEIKTTDALVLSESRTG